MLQKIVHVTHSLRVRFIGKQRSEKGILRAKKVMELEQLKVIKQGRLPMPADYILLEAGTKCLLVYLIHHQLLCHSRHQLYSTWYII